ncbi:MAG: hypothetical protein ABIH92_06000 [Nanoarchaeota archaeon]
MSDEQLEVEGTENPTGNTREAIEEMKKQGFEFEGLGDKKVDEKPEKGKEPVKDTSKDGEPKETEEQPKEAVSKEEPKEAEEEPVIPEREERKPVWRQKMEEKREKQKKDKDVEILETLTSLKTDIEELKKGKPKESVDDDDFEKKKADLKAKYENVVDPGLLEDLTALIPRGTKSPEVEKKLTEIEQKLQGFDQLSLAQKKILGDNEYSKQFSSKVTPLIKKDYPQATDEDLQAINQKLKESYYDKRYLGLNADEIYLIKKETFGSDISPTTLKSGETGKRGPGRSQTLVDYATITDEEFEGLSDEEKEKVVEAKVKSSKRR